MEVFRRTWQENFESFGQSLLVWVLSGAVSSDYNAAAEYASRLGFVAAGLAAACSSVGCVSRLASEYFGG
jgi:hypothetical protein